MTAPPGSHGSGALPGLPGLAALRPAVTAEGSATVEVDGRPPVALTNLGKVLWPATGTTKGELLDYYVRASAALVPHIHRRPLTLVRFPDGVDGHGWYQTTCHHHPEWMATHVVPSPRPGGRGRAYCVVEDLAGLLWVGNLAAIELHPLLSTAAEHDRPTALVYDLDPGEGATLATCAEVALLLRADLTARGLAACAKTSGWAGLHVVVPLHTQVTYEASNRFARQTARRLAGHAPGLVTARMARAERAGRVFVDWTLNHANRSVAAPYSPRAMPWPSVSTPLTWEEVAEVAGGADAALPPVDLAGALSRLERHGDLFAPVLSRRQALPATG